MPRQLSSVEEFNQVLGRATECRVVRRKGKVKLKLRTLKQLYVYVVNETDAEKLLKDIKLTIVEI